jgi:hypothetical protein
LHTSLAFERSHLRTWALRVEPKGISEVQELDEVTKVVIRTSFRRL